MEYWLPDPCWDCPYFDGRCAVPVGTQCPEMEGADEMA